VGVIDDVKFFHEVVDPKDLGKAKPVQEWGFRAEGKAAVNHPKIEWRDPRLKMLISQGAKNLVSESPSGESVSMAFDPVTFERCSEKCEVKIGSENLPMSFERALGWHRIDLDGVKPLGKGNDVIERIPFTLTNPSKREQIARLMFSKSGGGLRGRLGSPITGISAILCDEEGAPTGIPVQLSKNWHNESSAGVYKGTWFHGITQLRLPFPLDVR